MNTTQRSRMTTLRIFPSDLGVATEELNMAIRFDPATRTYHFRTKDSK